MLSLKDMVGSPIAAQDGTAGKVKDVIFDSATWRIVGFVAEDGSWFHRQQILVSPAILAPSNWPNHALISSTTKVETWRTRASEDAPTRGETAEFRSFRRLRGQRVLASSSELGRLQDLMVDPENWRVRFLMIKVRSFGGYKLMICANRTLVESPGKGCVRLGDPIPAG